MLKIPFVNIKGGVGKTMAIFNISACLSERGKSVLLIDADPQHNLSKACLGNKGKAIANGLYELLMGECQLSDIIYQPYPNTEELVNIFLIPSNYNLFLYDKNPENPNSIYRLKEVLNQLKNFDYVLIDTNPSLSFVLTSVLAASDAVVSVFDSSDDSIDGFVFLKENLIKSIQQTVNPELKIAGIILNNHDRRTTFSEDIITLTDKHFPKLRFNTIVKTITLNKHSRALFTPVLAYDNRHQSSLQWIDLAGEFIKRMEA